MYLLSGIHLVFFKVGKLTVEDSGGVYRHILAIETGLDAVESSTYRTGTGDQETHVSEAGEKLSHFRHFSTRSVHRCSHLHFCLILKPAFVC